MGQPINVGLPDGFLLVGFPHDATPLHLGYQGMTMIDRLRRLMCRMNGGHDIACFIQYLPTKNVQRHVHFCQDCPYIESYRVEALNPWQALPNPGLNDEDQREYMN
jgi:hypothetical protein